VIQSAYTHEPAASLVLSPPLCRSIAGQQWSLSPSEQRVMGWCWGWRAAGAT